MPPDVKTSGCRNAKRTKGALGVGTWISSPFSALVFYDSRVALAPGGKLGCWLDDNGQSLIEEEFLKSWDSVEAGYASMNAYPRYAESAKLYGLLVAELRRRGYDRRLRAGLQIGCLVLSRSEKHGLRSGQPYLSTNFSRNNGLELHYRDVNGQIEAVTDKVEFTPELESLLERLAAHPID